MIRISLRQFLVNVYAEARSIARMQITVLELVVMWEDEVSFRRVAHVFLSAEICDRQIKMQRRCHRHRAQISRSMASSLNTVEIGEHGNLAQMRNPTRVRHRATNVIDQLLFDQILAIHNMVENFAYSEWSRRVLTNEAEFLLIFTRRRIFKPKETIWFEILSEACSFNGTHAMMTIVEKMNVPS